MKRCTKCGQSKPIAEFTTLCSGKRAGYTLPTCRDCANASARDYLRRKPRSPEYVRNARLKTLYGITLADYSRMFAEQGGRCRLCRREPLPKYPNLDVDHCHRTKRVRGLLCRTCNIHIGFIENHRAAIEQYLAAPGRGTG